MSIVAPNIILPKGVILVSITTSPSGVSADNTGCSFGYVWSIYNTCDSVQVGDVILFENNKGIEIRYQNNTFFLVMDNYILTIESGGAP